MTTYLTRHDKLPLLLFILWGLLLYSNSVNVPFYFDDLNNIENNSPIQINSLSVKNLYDAAIKSHIPTRPVSNITLAINYYFNQLYVQELHQDSRPHTGVGYDIFPSDKGRSRQSSESAEIQVIG